MVMIKTLSKSKTQRIAELLEQYSNSLYDQGRNLERVLDSVQEAQNTCKHQEWIELQEEIDGLVLELQGRSRIEIELDLPF